MNHDDDVASLGHEWLHNPSLNLGRRLFERVPDDQRPAWAASVLRSVLPVVFTCPPTVANVLTVADAPAKWGTAHAAFTAVRLVVLRLDEKRRRQALSLEDDVFGHVLGIAELVAKVTYNATHPRDEFDEDSGWFIAGNTRALVALLHDPTFERAAWDALSRPRL